MQYHEKIDKNGTSVVNVKKANSIIRSLGKESLLANKILLTALLKVKLSDGEDLSPESEHYFKSLQSKTGVDFSSGLVAEMDNATLRTAMNETSGSYYTAISDIMDPASDKSLVRQWGIVLDNPKAGLYGFVSIITAAVYDSSSGKLFVKFSDEKAIQAQIYNIRNGYTSLNYRVMMNFKNVYSYKLYELLLSSIGLDDFKSGAQSDTYAIKFGISELKYRFGVLDALSSKEVRIAIAEARNADDYERIEKTISKEKRKAANFYEFEQRVIKKAVCEINELSDAESDYTISYSFEFGSSKRTPKTITFTVTRRHRTCEQEIDSGSVADTTTVEQPSLSDVDRQLEIIDEMRGFIKENLKSRELLAIAKTANYDMERVRRAYDIIEQSPTKINNFVAYFKTAIRDNYNEPVSKKGKKDNSAWADIKSETNVDLDELANNLVKKRMLRGDGLLGKRSEDR